MRNELVLILIVFLIASVTAFQGNSSSYTSDTKLDFGLTDNSTSSSYTSEIISGFELVGDYAVSFLTGRFGVLDDLINASDFPVITDISINSTDGSNQSNIDLNCVALINDSNSDPLNVTVKWYKDSIEELSIDYLNQTSNAYFVANLDYKNTSRGENWSCALRAFDGIGLSNWTYSGGLIVLNSIPIVTLESPSNGASVTNRTPTFNWAGYDEDGDDIIYDFNISLVALSLCTDLDQFVENLSTNFYTTSILDCFFDNQDYYVWSVRVKDNVSTSAWADYFNLSISALIDISVPTSSVSFGSIPFLGSNNTTDNSPPPFVIQNNGNSLINLNISANDLWETVSNPTSFYQIKVDNVSGEEDAFNWTGSTTDWVDVPALNNTIFINQLNYLDSIDSSEVDVYVEVPNNEPPTVKTSTVTFVSSFAE
ncbi:MAG: hypothetical protein ABFQ65_04320 [Nanoarchaeota archaeon]